MGNSNGASLRAMIAAKEFVLAPGVFDGISVRLAETMPFRALYMTGYGVTASHLGLPDAGLATYTDMVGRARTIAGVASKRLIAGADTGCGGLLNGRHTVRGYEDAGVAAIQIEDQEMPKKCGHTPGRRVVPLDEMVLKIRVAVDSRSSGDTLIVARTDARTSLGLDEALRRAAAFQAAGADVIFVESPESEAEMQRIGREVDAPLLANMVPGGRGPAIPADTLQAWGYAVAIWPEAGFTAAAEAMRRAYAPPSAEGTAGGTGVPTLSRAGAMHELMGFPDGWDFDEGWAVQEK